jgi:hypothetical protein
MDLNIETWKNIIDHAAGSDTLHDKKLIDVG